MSSPSVAQYADSGLLSFLANYLMTSVDGVGDWGRTPSGEMRRPANIFVQAIQGLDLYQLTAYSDVPTTSPTFRFRRARGVEGTPLVILQNDELGALTFQGYDGIGFENSAQYQIVATENWTAAAHGSRTEWHTTLTGTILFAERAQIDDNGDFIPGATATYDLGRNSRRWDRLHLETSLSIDGNQVLAARQTGWTAATGVADRTTFATATVTLPELAERVKALIDDILTHGAIGA